MEELGKGMRSKRQVCPVCLCVCVCVCVTKRDRIGLRNAVQATDVFFIVLFVSVCEETRQKKCAVVHMHMCVRHSTSLSCM
jgi:hypothetical protein